MKPISVKPISAAELGLALLTTAALTAPVYAQTTIGTTMNGAQANTSVSAGGDYLGQVFTAPSDSVLEDFSVQLANVEYSTDFSIYALNTNTNLITGPALFSSGPVSGVTVPTGYMPYTALEDTYQTGGLTLTAGGTYLALITNMTPNLTQSYAPLFYDSPFSYQYYPGYDYYPGGYFTSEYSQTGPFSPGYTGADLAFRADFGPAAVPEASATVSLGLLLALGLGGVIIAKRKKASAA